MGTPRQGTVLVADDDPATRALVRDALDDEGYRVTAAANADAALAALAADRFGLVLANTLGAPPGDLEREAARLLAVAGDTPVVLFSAYPQREFGGWQGRGFAGLLAKPFALDDLLATVRRHLG